MLDFTLRLDFTTVLKKSHETRVQGGVFCLFVLLHLNVTAVPKRLKISVGRAEKGAPRHFQGITWFIEAALDFVSVHFFFPSSTPLPCFDRGRRVKQCLLLVAE